MLFQNIWTLQPFERNYQSIIILWLHPAFWSREMIAYLNLWSFTSSHTTERTLYITVTNRMAIRCHVDVHVNNCTRYSNIAATCSGCKQPSSVSALRHQQISKPVHCHFCTDGSPHCHTQLLPSPKHPDRFWGPPSLPPNGLSSPSAMLVLTSI